jgi:hypothetical protein
MIPSATESEKALASARKALDEHERFWLGNPGKVEAELYALDLLTESERFVAVDFALQEISGADRKGPAPPNHLSSHSPFRGLQLFAFKWQSKHFGKLMYLKFALVSDSGPTKLALFSLHESD